MSAQAKTTPFRLTPHFDAIPEELRALPQWVCWKYQPEPKGGKQRKVPVDPKDCGNASSTNPATWDTFENAKIVFEANKWLAGIGFVFTKDDPYAGIDVDHCLDREGIPNETAKRLLTLFDSYSEKSPSQTGLHIIVRCGKELSGKKKDDVEVYTHSRYFTFTGRTSAKRTKDIRDHEQALVEFYDEFFLGRGTRERSQEEWVSGSRYGMTALREELDKLRRANEGERNTTLNAVAFSLGQLVAGGELTNQGDVEDAIKEVAAEIGLGDAEIIATMRHGMSAGLLKPRKAPDRNAQEKKAAETSSPLDGITVEGGKLPVVVDDAETQILMRADLLPEHRVFQRSTQLVRIARLPATGTADGVTRHQGTTRIMEVDRAGLQDVLGRYGAFKKWDGRAKDYRRIDPPKEIAETYMSRCGMWRVPVLRGVVAGPTIMPDGRIIGTPGYDPETSFFFAHDLKVDVPDSPTREDAGAALAKLEGLLAEFPFIEDKDRAVGLAQIITLVVRPATETAPLVATTAPTRGSGKSKLGDLAAAIGTGRPCTVLSATADPIELEKRIGGTMLAGDPLVSLDNVNGVLRSDLLCQAITAPAVKVRRLGLSDPIEVPNVATWLANGNNLSLAGDLARRAIQCRLDPGMERPEERVFSFDPVAVAMERRSEFVSAVLTLIRAFILAGSPDPGLKPFGSFETWCKMVRNPLVWAGCADPCESREEILDDDPDMAQLRGLVLAWHERFGHASQVVKDVVYASKEDSSPLGPILEDIAGDGRGNISTKKIGWWLRRHTGRVVDGFRISAVTTPKMVTWKVVPASE